MKKLPSDQYVKNMNRYMEDHWQYHNHLTYPRHQRRIKYVATLCSGKVLEVGCANGYSTMLMQLVNPSSVFHGVEATEWGFSKAKKFETDRIKFFKAFAEDLPFEDSTYDTVLLAEIIEHVEDPVVVADEAWRVCKKRLIITTPTKNHPDPDHKRFFSYDMMRSFCSKYSGSFTFTGLDSNGDITNIIKDIYFGVAIIEK